MTHKDDFNIGDKALYIECAHYYGHEDVGAYDVLFFFDQSKNDTLFISTLISLHMKPYERG